MRNLRIGISIILIVLAGGVMTSESTISTPEGELPRQAAQAPACTSFCMQQGDHCVFGTNFDDVLDMGSLFVNKRHVRKTNWDPNPDGEFARWTSRYGSVTVNLVGYQLTWSGMNEAGLMISTMSLNQTEGPEPDDRLPFESPFWMQYQLDNHSTVEQVLASDAEIRVPPSQVDHYLVCDRTGACGVLEFLGGRLVHYAGETLPIKALTNSTYAISLGARDEILEGAGEGYGNSIHRFVTAAEKIAAFEASDFDDPVQYAFDTLEDVSRDDTVWSFVYDPVELRVYFRTAHNPHIRTLAFSDLDFSCQTPVRTMDVHEELQGDVSEALVAYDHRVSFAHTQRFFAGYSGADLAPFFIETLLRGLESFSCQEGELTPATDLEPYSSLIPPRIRWGGLALLYKVWPVWILLTVLSLAFVLTRIALKPHVKRRKRITWVLITALCGPFGLLAFLASERSARLTDQYD